MQAARSSEAAMQTAVVPGPDAAPAAGSLDQGAQPEPPLPAPAAQVLSGAEQPHGAAPPPPPVSAPLGRIVSAVRPASVTATAKALKHSGTGFPSGPILNFLQAAPSAQGQEVRHLDATLCMEQAAVASCGGHATPVLATLIGVQCYAE